MSASVNVASPSAIRANRLLSLVNNHLSTQAPIAAITTNAILIHMAMT